MTMHGVVRTRTSDLGDAGDASVTLSASPKSQIITGLYAPVTLVTLIFVLFDNEREGIIDIGEWNYKRATRALTARPCSFSGSGNFQRHRVTDLISDCNKKLFCGDASLLDASPGASPASPRPPHLAPPCGGRSNPLYRTRTYAPGATPAARFYTRRCGVRLRRRSIPPGGSVGHQWGRLADR